MDESGKSEAALEFEQLQGSQPHDETDYGLRAYVTRIAPEKLARYRTDWTDEEAMEWDGGFKSDGGLMLVCCEREVEVGEFRKVVEEFIQFSAGR